MSDNNDLFAEFQEFLTAKQEAESKEKESEDYDVEVWDKDGRGARVKRSHAKPFLQSLGIDLDPPTDSGDSDDKGNKDKKATGKPAGKSTTGADGVTKKYFTPKAK